jgi:hypothetical protein
MAKSPEEKLLTAFENNPYFDSTEFARVFSTGSPQVQIAFYHAMIGYISYKAVFADHYAGELPKDSVVLVCQYLRDCLQDYFPEILEAPRVKTHYRNEII